jgi:hypothetical protein
MNEQDVFNTPEQEAKLLAGEIHEVKEVLRELSRKLSRIESRAKRAFPAAFPKPPSRVKGTTSRTTSAIPTMTAEQVIRVYDEVVDQARGGNIKEARERLESMEIPDLNLLRTELGASIGKKKPSKPVLTEAILGRVNESVMISKHTNRNQLIDQASNGETIPDPLGNEES